jgi:hypothetical protein
MVPECHKGVSGIVNLEGFEFWMECPFRYGKIRLHTNGDPGDPVVPAVFILSYLFVHDFPSRKALDVCWSFYTFYS